MSYRLTIGLRRAGVPAVLVDVCSLSGGSAVGNGSGIEITNNTTFNTDNQMFTTPVVGGFTVYHDVDQHGGGGKVTVLVVDHLVIDDDKVLAAIGSQPLVVYALADKDGNPATAAMAAPKPCPMTSAEVAAAVRSAAVGPPIARPPGRQARRPRCLPRRFLL